MKKYVNQITILFPLLYFAQPNTEVFLFDLNQENGGFELSNFRNISNNEGYDNQPSFMDNNTILYAGTRNGQTDIVEYNVVTGDKRWICNTAGSEYSPLKIPGQNAVSAIRLDQDGTQVLRKYDLQNGSSEVLIDAIVIGYHLWFNRNILVSAVLEDDAMSLFTSALNENQSYRWQKKVGRSLHKIPHSELVSYISKEKDIWEIKSLEPITGTTTPLFKALPKSEDMCWLSNGTAIMAKDGMLYSFHIIRDDDWVELASLSEFGIKNITRLAVSLDGTKLAIVGEKINP